MTCRSGLDCRRTRPGRQTFSGVPGNGLAGKLAAKCSGSAKETSSQQSEGAGFWCGSCADAGEDEGVIVVVEVRRTIRKVFHANVGAVDRTEAADSAAEGCDVGVVVAVRTSCRVRGKGVAWRY